MAKDSELRVARVYYEDEEDAIVGIHARDQSRLKSQQHQKMLFQVKMTSRNKLYYAKDEKEL